jgi:hypothetical protein
MKNQYFADERDYGKYDLLIEVVQKIGALERLTIIPMLTGGDDSGEGDRINYEQGCRRSDLHRYLQDCLSRKDRNVAYLREYFKRCGIDYRPYSDTEFFTHEGRSNYFTAIQDDCLKKALVFFDPDTGLEHDDERYMKSQGPEKYLLWNELTEVWNRMSQESACVVYQHLQRNVGRAYSDMLRKGKMLCQRLSIPSVICVDQIEVAFYVFSRCRGVFALLLQLMPFYAGMVGLRFQVISEPSQETQA